jgi:predicted RNase H-like nuclease
VTAAVVVGVDLAWSARNRSGVAVARPDGDGYRLDAVVVLILDDDIIDAIERAIGDGPGLVTIDAPLRVPNETGRRACERALSADYGARHAGTHSSNRTTFAAYGGVRGERIVERLSALGLVLRDGDDLPRDARSVVEVYPHPALVELLAVPRALKYKRKSKRTLDERAEGWRALKAGVRGFADAAPSLRGADALLDENDVEISGRARKSYEDRVDAVVCAYIGVHALHWGLRGCRVYGKVDEGAILVPVRPPDR